VPVLRLQVAPEVAPTAPPAPGLHLDTEQANGEAITRGLFQVAAAARQIGEKAREDADAVAVEEAETEFQNHVTEQLWGKDGQGALTKQGKQAVAASSPTLEGLSERQAKIAERLNDRQRQAFIKRTNGSLIQAQRQVEAHVGAQVNVAAEQAFNAKKSASLDTVANAYDQPEVVKRERQNAEPWVMLEAKRRGLEGWETYPPKVDSAAGQFLEAWRADVAKTVVTRMLADPDKARGAELARKFLAEPATGSLPPVPAGGTPHDLSKPVLQNPDGTWSTEKTITIETDGKHVVLPTIVNGKDVGAKRAAALYKAGELEPVGTFDSAAAAESYAQARHLEEQQLRGPGGPRTNLQVLGGEADKYLAAIRGVEAEVDAFDLATRAIEGARDKQSGRVDELAARRAIAGAPRSLRKDARLNLESLLNGEQESWTRQVTDHWNVAKTAYLGGPDGKGKKGLVAIPGTTSTWLRRYAPDTWRALQGWAENDAKERQEGKPTAGQESAFVGYMVDAIDHPEQFVRLNGAQVEEKYLANVAPSQRRALLGQILQTKANAQRPDETLPASVVKELLAKGRPGGGGAGIFPAKGDDPAQFPPDKAQLFNAILQDLLQLQAERKAAGTPAKPEDFSKRIDEHLRKVVVKGTGGAFSSDDVVPRVRAQTDPRYAGKEIGPAPAKIPGAKAKEYRKLLQADRKHAIAETDAVLQYLWAIDPANPQRDSNAQAPEEFFRTYDVDEVEAYGRARVGTLSP
jgi:hypothetical protein